MSVKINVLISSLMIFSLTPLCGQELDVNRFYSMYKGKACDFHISLGRPVIQMISWFFRDEPEKSLIKSARNVKVLVFEHRPSHLQEDLNALITNLHQNHFDEWVTVRESGEEVRILGREEDNFIRDFVVLVDEPDEFVMVSITGKIDPNALSALVDKERKRSTEF